MPPTPSIRRCPTFRKWPGMTPPLHEYFPPAAAASAPFSAKPTWQTALTPSDGHRDVPDVALNASPNHDGSLICSQAFFAPATTPTSCVSGFRASDGSSLAVVGGTSVGAPTFAGIVAILNQAARSRGGGLGNINPTLYTPGSRRRPLHFTTSRPATTSCLAPRVRTGCPVQLTLNRFQRRHRLRFGHRTGFRRCQCAGDFVARLCRRPQASQSTVTAATVSTPGQRGTSTITVSATNGFSGTVDLDLHASGVIVDDHVLIRFDRLGRTRQHDHQWRRYFDHLHHRPARCVAATSASLQSPHGFGWLPASSSALLAGIFILGGVPSRARRRMAGLGLMLLVSFAAGRGLRRRQQRRRRFHEDRRNARGQL